MPFNLSGENNNPSFERAYNDVAGDQHNENTQINNLYIGTIPNNNDTGMANYRWSYFGCPLISMEHAT